MSRWFRAAKASLFIRSGPFENHHQSLYVAKSAFRHAECEPTPVKTHSAFQVQVDRPGGVLSVANFSTRDPETVEYFAELPASERLARFETAVRIGVMGLRTIGTTKRVDYVDKRFDALRESFEKKLEQVFGENGEVQRTVKEYFGEHGHVPELIDEVFGKDGDLSEVLEEHFGKDGTIVKKLFDPFTPGTPLAGLRDEFERQIVALRKDLGLAEEAEAIAKVTPIKGYEFEDEVEDILCDLARPVGDLVQRTTDKAGHVKGSKKGDFVVSIGERPDIKVVFETKDVETISIAAIESEMKEAIKNRAASFGVFVARNVETLPKSVGWFNEYWSNTLVFALGERSDEKINDEVLRIGYKWARTRALAARAQVTEGVDVTEIQNRVEECRRALKRFGQVRTQCTNAKQAVDAVLQEIAEIQTAIETNLDTIGAEVLKATAR